jgi:hypothetical protein
MYDASGRCANAPELADVLLSSRPHNNKHHTWGAVSDAASAAFAKVHARSAREVELYALEDVIADDGEDAEEGRTEGVVSRMVVLSGRMVGDAAFGRQLRRKFVA